MIFIRKPLAVLPFVLFATPLAAEPLATAPVEYRSLASEELFDGTVEAVNQSTVAAQTSGRVLEVLFDVDDYVARGTVVVRLRDTEQQARLARAEGLATEAGARLEEAADAQRRHQELYAQKVASKAALDRAVANFKAARAALEAARAQVDEAREQLEHTMVRAPYSGIVVERGVQPGETVQPGSALMTGLSLESLRVNAYVPQRLVAPLRAGGTARVLLEDGAQPIEVRDLTVSPRADLATRSFRVRVALPEGTHGLFPGMAVKLAVATGEAQRLLVPERSVVHRSEVTGVYVLVGDRVVFRQVRVGRRHGDSREVLAGLHEGEQVALDPVQATIFLKAGNPGN
ncbi:MAG: efflux RND transporter periplasmic adaptor subunit [Gammaproteobacteria bacterium]|jgi:RND family efflux transporter MFP subunit|nr:efflux RND transporter periplasmic adaptor subunit [Gammaproteobacteria bacterium]